LGLFGQTDSLRPGLTFHSDFRFRAEQDWNSKKSDGTFREDRTRFRYRLRAGVTYAHSWYQTGFRLRTGNPNKQQDPQLTLGEGFKEFGTLPIGLEKAYFQGTVKPFTFWVGKNTFPFEKNNELFWSDNVFPEGISLSKGFRFDAKVIDTLILNGGHFIIDASGESLRNDGYFQGYQLHTSLFERRLELFPSLYSFKNIPNIPDGAASFIIDYTILHIGSRLHLWKGKHLRLEFDYYLNLQDYSKNDSIASRFTDQKKGWVLSLKYGQLNQEGDWQFAATYAYLEQYAAVDIMAQNDWARWNYASFGSPDGRLTNLNGVELVAAYMINKKLYLTMKYYRVKQLVPYGISKETGSRVRFDLDIAF
jgi:hypothetical protein